MPVVMVNAGVDDLGFPHISTDDAVAVEQAYGHLKSLGHQRIGMVMGPEDHVPSRRKLAALAKIAADDWSSSAPRSRWRAPGWPRPG
jgi:DNA-binding LacI/PurR family transcriptional regulator